MYSPKDYGYSGMDNCIKVHHFLLGIKSTEFDAVVNVVWAQPERYDADCKCVLSGPFVTKKDLQCNLSVLKNQDLACDA